MIYSHEYIYYGVALEKSDNFLYNQKKKNDLLLFIIY